MKEIKLEKVLKLQELKEPIEEALNRYTKRLSNTQGTQRRYKVLNNTLKWGIIAHSKSGKIHWHLEIKEEKLIIPHLHANAEITSITLAVCEKELEDVQDLHHTLEETIEDVFKENAL